MTKQKLEELNCRVADFCKNLPEDSTLRLGQIYMNQLFDVDIETYRLICASVFDPFYKDETLPFFIKYISSICVD